MCCFRKSEARHWPTGQCLGGAVESESGLYAFIFERFALQARYLLLSSGAIDEANIALSWRKKGKGSQGSEPQNRLCPCSCHPAGPLVLQRLEAPAPGYRPGGMHRFVAPVDRRSSSQGQIGSEALAQCEYDQIDPRLLPWRIPAAAPVDLRTSSD